jgi:hypothetical protein
METTLQSAPANPGRNCDSSSSWVATSLAAIRSSLSRHGSTPSSAPGDNRALNALRV